MHGERNNGYRNGYAAVNGLNMYYEIHGTGSPLVLLHGSLTTIDTSFGKFLPALEKARKVIAVEQQGHGRTADIDRPLTYEQMAEDTTELLRQVGIEICTEEDKEQMQALLVSENELAANLAFEILEEIEMEELAKRRLFLDI